MSTVRRIEHLRPGESLIEDGIEWYCFMHTFVDRNGVSRTVEETDCQCARCGSSCGFVDCGGCAGEGEVDCYEENPLWYSEGDTRRCHWCRGTGGGWHCLSGSDWCNANPMKGREHIKTTAMVRDD